jgi:hypothetical protein
MTNLLSKYKHLDTFIFKMGDNLREVCNAPKMPGVYLVYAFNRHETSQLVYIGKSGTMNQNGTFSKQSLNGRLLNQHYGLPRQGYFEKQIKQFGFAYLKVEWYVTFDDNHTDLPGYIEGLLIQEFFNVNRKLPDWNKKY